MTFVNESKRATRKRAKQEVPRRRTLMQRDIEEVVSLSPKQAPLQPQLNEPEEDEESFTDCETSDAIEDSRESNTSTDSVIEVFSVLPPQKSLTSSWSQVMRRRTIRDTDADDVELPTYTVNQDQFSGITESVT